MERRGDRAVSSRGGGGKGHGFARRSKLLHFWVGFLLYFWLAGGERRDAGDDSSGGFGERWVCVVRYYPTFQGMAKKVGRSESHIVQSHGDS